MKNVIKIRDKLFFESNVSHTGKQTKTQTIQKS